MQYSNFSYLWRAVIAYSVSLMIPIALGTPDANHLHSPRQILGSRVVQPSDLGLCLNLSPMLAIRDVLPYFHPLSIEKIAGYDQPTHGILNVCPHWVDVPPLDWSLSRSVSLAGKDLPAQPIYGGWPCHCMPYGSQIYLKQKFN